MSFISPVKPEEIFRPKVSNHSPKPSNQEERFSPKVLKPADIFSPSDENH